MNIAEKNIKAIQRNPFGKTVIEFIIKKGNNFEIPFEIQSTKGSYNDWKRVGERLDFDKHTNYVILGIGNGSILKKIYKKMSFLSTITIIEKYGSVLINTLGKQDLSSILHDKKVSIISAETDLEINVLLKTKLLDENFIYNTPNIQIIIHPYMRSHDEDFVNKILYYISSTVTYNTTSFGNDINDVLEGLDHIVDNWKNMADGLGINSFKNAYKDIPAIIVSAGPSLDKNIQMLKKAKNKALIFAVDATAKKIMNIDIIPDGISTIERPDVMFDIFYKEMNISDQTVFIGPPVVSKDILDKFANKIITGRQGEIIVKSATEFFGYDSIEIGMSCSHIPFGFAKYIGANPIIFIGQDLSFSPDGKTHFGDVEKYVANNANKNNERWVTGNNGEKLWTNSAYYSFLLWFENQIANTNGTTFINATEGGARIKGTEVMSLSDAIDKYCNKEIQHLSEYYKKKESENRLSINEIKDRTNEYFDKLISDSGNLREFISIEREKLFSEVSINKLNFESFYSEIIGIYKEISKNDILRFILQPYYVSYYRSIHQYPVNLNSNDWNKLIFESNNYHLKLIKILDVLKTKFLEYKRQVEGELN